MAYRFSASALALMIAGAFAPHAADAQVANTTASNVNLLNLLSPFLGLNGSSVGQATLTANLQQAIATNNAANLALQQLAISDKSILGAASNNLASVGLGTYGVAANLGGGLPAQTPVNGITPQQPVGGLGSVLGPIYQTGVASGTAGPLGKTVSLLVGAYNFASSDLGVAKFYFANGTINGTTTAVAPLGFVLPTANGLPNSANSVYDLAYGVTNAQAGQNIYGDSRPVQVDPNAINKFDPTALNGLATNPSFPSGHTTYAYTDSILLAMLVPQAYQSMLLRGSAYANSRIVLGVHYPLDIIASRALASYDLAQALTNPLYINNAATTGTAINLGQLFAQAAPQMQTYLATQCGASVATCAASAANVANDPYAPSAANQAVYTARLTYGLPTLTFAQAPREAAPAGGPDASILLAPIYGGSTTAAQQIAPSGGLYGTLQTSTINQIVVNTEATALAAFYGTSLSYWTRLDLYAASGYLQNVTGTLSLAPSDQVTTDVTIGSGGVFAANGTVAAHTIVTGSGTLAGSGTVGAVTVASGGTLAPGSLAAQAALKAGTKSVTGTQLSVNGAIGFAPGATLAIFATPSQATSVVATGAASIGGAAVDVTANGTAFSLAKKYTILTAQGGVTGRFVTTTTNLPFLSAALSYSPEAVALSFAPNAAAFAGVAVNSNQAHVAGGLLNAARDPGNAGNPIVAATFNQTSAAQARSSLDALSGQGIAAAQNIAHRSGAEFTSAIFDQTTFYNAGSTTNSISLSEPAPGFLAYAPTDGTHVRELADLPASSPTDHQPAAPLDLPRTWRAWAAGFGGVEDIHGDGATGSTAQNNTIYGGTIGVDYQLTSNYLVGVAIGGSDGEFSVPGAGTSGSTTGGHVAVYDLATFGDFYGASSTSFSYYTNKTSRAVSGIGGLASETERGAFDSHEFRSRLEFGRHVAGFDGSVTPFVALELAELRSNGFNETAVSGPGLFALNISGQSAASVPAFVGARFARVTTLGNGVTLTPTLQVAYVHEFAPERSQSGTLVNLPGSTFLVDGARVARDAAQVKLGSELAIGPHSVLFANFDGEFSGASQLYAGHRGFRFMW